MIKNAVVFAAGFGTRMLPITEHIPKPLVKITDKTLLSIIIDKIFAAGIEKIYVNCHHKSELIVNHIQQHNMSHRIHAIYEHEILETGGALANIAPMLNSKACLTANTDVVWEEDCSHIAKMIDAWDSTKMDILALLHEKNRVHGYYGEGDFSLRKNNQLAIPKQTKKYMYMGIQIINTEILKNIAQKHFSLTAVYENLKQKNKALQRSFGIVHERGKIFHVGDVDTLQKAQEASGIVNIYS